MTGAQRRKTFAARDGTQGGKWSGAFFSLGAGGGGSSYENTFASDTENISVGLCGGTAIFVKPGLWYNSGFLTEIDERKIPLKANSNAKLPIFGPSGAIPSVVTGIIVAKQVRVSGKLSEEKRSEIKTQSGRRGGFKVGPLKIGGGSGGSSYKYTENKDSGEFLLSSAFETPVVVAVVLKDTPASSQAVTATP